MIRRRVWQQLAGIAILQVAVGCLVVVPSAAQDQATVKKDEAAQQLEQEQQGLEATHKRQKELEGNLKAFAKERDQLNRQLIATASAIQDSEVLLSGMEKKLGDLSEQRRLQQAHFATQTRELGQLLTVLQRMGSNPPPAMITHRKDALAMVRSAMMLSTVFPEHRDKALLLKRELDKLDRVLAEETKQRDLVKSEHERLAAEQARLDPLIEAKRLAITETEQELAGLRTLAKTQAKSVLDIRDLIKTLDKAVADKTALGAYETELAEAVLAGHEPEPPAAVPTSPDAGEALAGDAAPDIQAGSTPERPLAADVAFLDPGRIKPAVPFDKAKGLLPSPVRGDMILSFGQKTRSGSKSKGIAYATRAQAQITSPCDGWVVYAGEFRSYGQVLIINAGGGYHLLLAGMAQINVQVGQFVLSSEPVGKMGAARQSADGAGEPAPPILYLELRSKERPINPDPWWGPSGQKVANG